MTSPSFIKEKIERLPGQLSDAIMVGQSVQSGWYEECPESYFDGWEIWHSKKIVEMTFRYKHEFELRNLTTARTSWWGTKQQKKDFGLENETCVLKQRVHWTGLFKFSESGKPHHSNNGEREDYESKGQRECWKRIPDECECKEGEWERKIQQKNEGDLFHKCVVDETRKWARCSCCSRRNFSKCPAIVITTLDYSVSTFLAFESHFNHSPSPLKWLVVQQLENWILLVSTFCSLKRSNAQYSFVFVYWRIS